MDGLPRVVAIEYPCNVQDEAKALSMVGGSKAIERFVADPESGLELRLRPDNFHHPVRSRQADIQTIVLEIDLPQHVFDAAKGDVPEAIRLAGPDAKVAPRLVVSKNIRFREMADYQYYTGDVPFVREVEESICAGDYEKINKLSLDSVALSAQDVLPPPRFSLQSQPIFYKYKQNPSVSIVDDGSGEIKLVNKTKGSRIISSQVNWGEPIPHEPPRELDPHPREPVAKCVDELRRLLEARPSYTRKALQALVSPDSQRQLRLALPYVTYYFRSGPWRGAYMRYGVDPTSNPDMAVYQVEHFRIHPEGARPSATSDGRLVFEFDGKTLPSANTIQLCDITDAFIAPYIKSAVRRSEANFHDGWFSSETMAVIRKVIRAKMVNINEHKPPLSEAEIEALVSEAKLAASQKDRRRLSSNGASENSDSDENEGSM